MAPDENIAKMPFCRLQVWVHTQEQKPSNPTRNDAKRRMVVSIPVEAGLRMTGPGLVGPGPGRSHRAPWSNQGCTPLIAADVYALTRRMGLQALNGPEGWRESPILLAPMGPPPWTCGVNTMGLTVMEIFRFKAESLSGVL